MEKKGFIWNTLGSLIYSFFNAILLMVCTRLNGVEIAGIFSICYATGSILNAIGDLGIRIFQVTDTNRKYKFEDYLYARIFAIILMVLIAIAFSIISGYTNEKLFICMILILIRVVDNFGETFQAEFQLNNRLDIAGKALLYRNVLEILSFTIFNIITHNIYISFISMLIMSILILIGYDFRLVKKNKSINIEKLNLENVKEIIRYCLPLGISTLINMYVINAVKYAIDAFGDNTMQTYFNVLYMPTFVINLISILIMKPLLKPFGEYWNSNQRKKLVKTIIKIILFLIGFTVITELLALTIGIPVLGWMYAIDLSTYRLELFLLILSGLLYASSTVIFYALGTIRKQKQTTISYAISAVAALTSNILVKNYGVLGSAISSVLTMITLFIVLIVFFIIAYIEEKKKEEKEKSDEKI